MKAGSSLAHQQSEGNTESWYLRQTLSKPLAWRRADSLHMNQAYKSPSLCDGTCRSPSGEGVPNLFINKWAHKVPHNAKARLLKTLAAKAC